LDLHDVSDVNGVDFIRHSFFPKLESAVLDLETRKDMTTQNDNTSPIPVILLPFLKKLGFYVPYSWPALIALKAFIPHPIRIDSVTIFSGGGSFDELLTSSPELVNSLHDTLTILPPIKLDLHLIDYHSVQFLLEALDTSLLEVLEIDSIFGVCKIEPSRS